MFASRALFVLALLACANLGTSFSPTKLIFLDEFDQDANGPNEYVWKHEVTLSGGGNWEFQAYTNNRSSTFLENGNLYIQPFPTVDALPVPGYVTGDPPYPWSMHAAGCTEFSWYGCERTSSPTNYLNPIMSGRISTMETFAFKYGKVEIRAKTPRGDWIWPAMWMLPQKKFYGNWPASGEIDILESRGNSENYDCDDPVDYVSSALHWGAFWPSQWPLTFGNFKGLDFSENFHVYTLEWTENYIKTMVDGNEILYVDTKAESFFDKGEGYDKTTTANPWKNRPNNAPFDTEYYLIFNVAVGGTGGFFADCVPQNPAKKPWENMSPTAMKEFWDRRDDWLPTWNLGDPSHPSALQVDWVKVWCDPGDPYCANKAPLIVN